MQLFALDRHYGSSRGSNKRTSSIPTNCHIHNYSLHVVISQSIQIESGVEWRVRQSVHSAMASSVRDKNNNNCQWAGMAYSCLWHTRTSSLRTIRCKSSCMREVLILITIQQMAVFIFCTGLLKLHCMGHQHHTRLLHIRSSRRGT